MKDPMSKPILLSNFGTLMPLKHMLTLISDYRDGRVTNTIWLQI